VEGIDLSALTALPGQLVTLLVDPSSNLTAALILYGIIAAGLLIVVLLAIMWLISLPDEDADLEAAEGAAGPERPVAAPTKAKSAPVPEVKTPKTARSLVIGMVVFALVVVGVWVTAGFTTSTDAVCLSCHADSPHADAAKGQPHENTRCIACHESGGVVGRYVVDVPSRLLHFVEGWAPARSLATYGSVSQSACSQCHNADIAGTTTNSKTGIKMSHVEPMAASATCIDCHQMQDGVVASHNAGMNPCLRCHDSKTASAKCVTCHDKKAAAAARARTTSFQAVQVAEVKCGGCHNEKKECDSCHGTRLPHTKTFMAGAHARAGAVNFWYEGGKTCARCHTAVRRPCTKCHTDLMGKAHGPSLAPGHSDGDSATCNACHQRFAPVESRDFCRDVCHSAAAIRYSPR